MKMKQTTLGLLAATALLAAPAANAQMLDTTVLLEAGQALTATGTSLDTDVTASTSITTPVLDTGIAASSSAGMEASNDNAYGFSLTSKSAAETEYAVRDASEVQSMASLEAYAGASIRDDERLESVTLNEDTMTLRYRTDAAFLGFIPASMNVTASVTADGAVTVKYPWYSFLMNARESRADLEARLTKEQGAVRDEIAETAVMGGADASVQARQWALMLERLRMSLYAQSSAEASR